MAVSPKQFLHICKIHTVPFISGVQYKSQFFHELSHPLSLSLTPLRIVIAARSSWHARTTLPTRSKTVCGCLPIQTNNLDKLEQQSRGTFANVPTDFLTWSAETLLSSVGVAIRLRTGLTRTRIPAGARGVFRHIISQTGSGTHPAFSSVGTDVLFRGQSGLGLHLVPSWSFIFSL